MGIDHDVRNWNADMDAWDLEGMQRVHHLRRLHHYHLRLMYRHLDRADRAGRIGLAFCVLAVAFGLIAVLL